MSFCLYGQIQGDLLDRKTIIENCLQIKMIEHDSFHWGGQYFLCRNNGKTLQLIKNWDLIDEIPAEEQFQNYKILLQAESLENAWCIKDLSKLINPWFVILRSD